MTTPQVSNNSAPSAFHKLQQKCCNTTVLKTLLVVSGILLVVGGFVAQVYQMDPMAAAVIGGLGGLFIGIASVIELIQRVRQCAHTRAEERRARNDQSTEAQRLATKETEKKTLEEVTQKYNVSLDFLISELRTNIETFKKIIANPAEPCGSWTNRPHQEKIVLCWTQLKTSFAIQDSSINRIKQLKIDQDPAIQQKLDTFSLLRNEFAELRRDSYYAYIQPLAKEKLISEANEYLRNSLSTSELYAYQADVILSTLVPKLKARLEALQQDNTESYKLIELQELVAILEKI